MLRYGKWISLLLVMLVCLPAPAGLAQDEGLDYTAEPNFGSVALSAGFPEVSYKVNIISGGTVDVGALNLGPNCRGYAARTPDFRLNWSGESQYLRFWFLAEDREKDATMVISTPSGGWRCNDDAYGIQSPMIDLFAPEAGQYDIWIGSYNAGEQIEGRLSISELALDTNRTSTYGRMSLESNFQPDPYAIRVGAGGGIDIARVGVGEGCTGYASVRPDFSVIWTGASSTGKLRIFFAPYQAEDGSKRDATIVINDPNNAWHCNDDFEGSSNPGIDIANPPEGKYDIWVGSYEAGIGFPGVLFITEMDYTASTLPEGTMDRVIPTLEYKASPTYGEQTVTAGFQPDPFTVRVVSGGNVDVSQLHLGQECAGFAAPPPDYRIQWEGESQNVRIFFVSDDGSDTTLIISDATAQWRCNDDSYDTTHPTIDITNPGRGQYDIWVGSYAENTNIEGTLYITEGDHYPGNVP